MRHTIIDRKDFSIIGVAASAMILLEFAYLIAGINSLFIVISAGGVALFLETLMRSKVTYAEVFLLLFIRFKFLGNLAWRI